MGIAELFLIAVGLAMDAFTVALCKGLNMKKINYKDGIIISLFFGVAQGFMPFLGWVLGSRFKDYIVEIDHWIAFALLACIGGKMILEAMGKEEVKEEAESSLNIKELFILAIATSIDALAVGITFAFLKVNIVVSVFLIGIITFMLSFAGVLIGNHFGMKLKAKAELAGGIILILIGTKILLEHLGISIF